MALRLHPSAVRPAEPLEPDLAVQVDTNDNGIMRTSSNSHLTGIPSRAGGPLLREALRIKEKAK